VQRRDKGSVLQAEILRQLLSAWMGRLDYRSSGVSKSNGVK